MNSTRSDKKQKEKVRRHLMDALLAEKDFRREDVARNIYADCMRGAIDERGRRVANRPLTFKHDQTSVPLHCISGFTFDNKGSGLTFSVVLANPKDVRFPELVTFDDLREVFTRYIDDGYVSLDSPDPMMQHHPYPANSLSRNFAWHRVS